MAGKTVLIVDDDTGLRSLISSFLADHGFTVLEAADVPAMRSLLATSQPDLIVLDLMMPGEDGLAALRTIPPPRPPVIMLSAMGGDIDRIVGLEAGADDYLPKPCNPRELLARIRAVLRRPDAVGEGQSYSFAGWRLDTGARDLRAPCGDSVELTPNEFRLLTVLVRGGRRVRSREELAEHLGGDDYTSFDRSIDLTVSRLRRKLAAQGGGDLVRTVRGEGYSLRCDATAERT